MKNVNKIPYLVVGIIAIFILITIGETVRDINEELRVISHNLQLQNTYLKIISEKESVVNFNQTIVSNEEKIIPTEVAPKKTDSTIFTATAYDNSVASQGKWVGKTATGYSVTGKSLEEARTIAVDPKVIPLNSKVQLTFDEPYKHLDGVYYARDTGGAIKGNRIDIFMGDGVGASKLAKDFGRRKVGVKILE